MTEHFRAYGCATIPNPGQAPFFEVECPHCHKSLVPRNCARFHYWMIGNGEPHGRLYFAYVCCPGCTQGHVIWYDVGMSQIVDFYPRMKSFFEFPSAPAPLRENFLEAAKCYNYECYRAAAILLRRGCELLCEHIGAQGASLHQRLEWVRVNNRLPDELFGLLGDLKLMGNDAAHWSERNFHVGREEVEVGFEVLGLVLSVFFGPQSLQTKMLDLKRKLNPTL